MSYSANQVKVFLNDIGKTDVEVPNHPDGRKLIRYKDDDPHSFVYDPDKGEYVYEASEEEIGDGEEVVTESHSGYYWK